MNNSSSQVFSGNTDLRLIKATSILVVEAAEAVADLEKEHFGSGL